jgi:hypothetical protein
MTQQELSLDNPNGYRCKHCGTDAEALAYSEEITVVYNTICIQDKQVDISSPENDYSCPTGARLWCTECDTYIWGDQAVDEGTADPMIEVHYA